MLYVVQVPRLAGITHLRKLSCDSALVFPSVHKMFHSLWWQECAHLWLHLLVICFSGWKKVQLTADQEVPFWVKTRSAVCRRLNLTWAMLTCRRSVTSEISTASPQCCQTGHTISTNDWQTHRNIKHYVSRWLRTSQELVSDWLGNRQVYDHHRGWANESLEHIISWLSQENSD